jgi:GNAT superfamily N-acetyltransferase
MITIRQINPRNRADARKFLRLPFRLYKDHPLWVPPILIDASTQLNPDKHPFYEHSEADFFLAEREGEVVGRIALLENRPYNEYHDKRIAQFYLFEFEKDLDIARGLIDRVQERAKARDLNQLVGPKGFGALDGYGMLVEGFEFRPAMTMMSYNPPFYPEFMQELGFEKVVDFVSCYLGANKFKLDERIHRIADRAARRSGLRVVRFKSKKQLKEWAQRIGKTYNESFIENWEYYPLTQNEIDFLTDNILTIADPRLIKIIARQDKVVGFLFGFPDVSAAIQRSKGRLLPFGIIDLLLEFKRTKWIALNGAGILPEYQGRGGNALLYSEMEKTIHSAGFLHADLTQVAESAVQMRRDLENTGAIPYKNHRVFAREI